MERKIGEIFEHNGEWYQCIKGLNCPSCFLNGSGNCDKMPCSPNERTDSTSVFFKKLEKVGEPYLYKGILMQPYRRTTGPLICDWKSNLLLLEHGDSDIIDIEIKQNKEVMEENKLNLKPFDIQKAKEGKPVCTRDGRRARIICFDAKFPKTGNIVTLVEKENGEEVTLYHYNDGHCSIGRGYDLMMLPEKKEGWVNVYYDNDAPSHREASWVYDKEEEAIKVGKEHGSCYIATVRIEWEE